MQIFDSVNNRKLETNSSSRNYKMFLFLSCIILVIVLSISNFQSENSNYRNSDATWHTLLTIKAYRETPASIHRFVPIVSLGGENDKGIAWGATVPDEHGNYFYTSFSPAGFAIPYFFMKMFDLPVTELSLYIFNTILFVISSLLIVFIVYECWDQSLVRAYIPIIALLTYALAPEILHGLGRVYWHHSIMQVTIPIQIYAFMHRRNSKTAYSIFLIMCLINPYIEWTGFVANLGFLIIELIEGWNLSTRISFPRIIAIATLSFLSFILFVVHFLSVLDSKSFIKALSSRFFSRSFTTDVSYIKLFLGYYESFGFIWLILIIGLIFLLILYKGWSWIYDSIFYRKKFLLFILLFPLLENILMKQHAIYYSFDRMKLIFTLCFMVCDMSNLILVRIKNRYRFILILAILAVGLINYKFYFQTQDNVWQARFRKTNIGFATYIRKNFADSIVGTDNNVRGYLNLLLGRGIYENVDFEELKIIGEDTGRQYAVWLFGDNNGWDLYQLKGALVYDLQTQELRRIDSSESILQE